MKKKVKIEIDDYYYDCAEGCCTTYGTRVKLNDVDLPCENTDLPTQITQILEHLGYEVELTETYNGELI